MFLGAAVKYGSKNEERARQAYVAAQQTNPPSLTCHPIGFVGYECQPFLGASPDGLVQDPNSIPQNGLLEIQCPFVARSGMTAKEYTEHKSSCLSPTFLLKPSHEYFLSNSGGHACLPAKLVRLLCVGSWISCDQPSKL